MSFCPNEEDLLGMYVQGQNKLQIEFEAAKAIRGEKVLVARQRKHSPFNSKKSEVEKLPDKSIVNKANAVTILFTFDEEEDQGGDKEEIIAMQYDKEKFY